MHRSLTFVVLSLVLTTRLLAQTTAISGVVRDPSGAVVPKVLVTVTNTQTGSERSDSSDMQGRYSISQLPPGTYSLTAHAAQFSDIIIQKIELLVNSPATVAVQFEKIGSSSTIVTVDGSSTQLNTVDASLGNVITTELIVELPSYARGVSNLLTFQPGVAYFGANSGTTEDRNGSVNGGRSDQSNYTFDGADVNQQSDRAAFSTVLRVTPDSVEEFRTTTSNGSGADVTLVTRSGTNDLHGSLYEYRRGAETAANSFFNNRSGVARTPLLINLFGASLGGRIKRNKAFFFINYEGRRDASSTSVNRNAPPRI